MRAMVAERLGAPDVLELKEVPVPKPGPGQVLVRLHAAGVNFADTERRRGVYDTPPLPWIPGGEGAGEIVDAGGGVDRDLIGRRVAFCGLPPAVSGTYAEYAVTPADSLFFLGPYVPFEVGAALPMQGLTAYGLAFLATRSQGSGAALVYAAAGGVGQILIQLLRWQGFRVFGAVSTPAKAAVVAGLGAEPLLYGEDLPARILAATDGRGLSWVFDSVGLATQSQSLAMLAPYGELIFFGEASGRPEPIDPGALYGRCLKVSAFGLNTSLEPLEWELARGLLLDWLAEGKIKVAVSRRFPLAEAAEAHRLLESRATTGKAVLIIGG